MSKRLPNVYKTWCFLLGFGGGGNVWQQAGEQAEIPSLETLF